MISVDFGSRTVKWFDGKNYGIGGIPRGRLIAGISSKDVFIKKAFYPVCKGSSLKKMILNDVSSDMGVAPEDIEVAFCPLEQKKKGCELLLFIERTSSIEKISSVLREDAILTIDLLGAVTAALEIYSYDSTFTVLDAGASKVAAVVIERGKPVSVEVLRAGFDSVIQHPYLFEEKVAPFLKGPVVLVGGGALVGDFVTHVEKYAEVVEIPKFSPFGAETPLFFTAYGLYKFRKSPCKAVFREPALFSSESLEKAKTPLFVSFGFIFASLVIYTASLYFSYLSVKKDYEAYKRSFYAAVEAVLGEKVVAPEIQIDQKLSQLKELRSWFLLDKPDILVYLHGISASVVDGVGIISVEGDISTGSFKIKGTAKSEEVLSKFRKNLLSRFSKVNVNFSKETSSGVKFQITVSGVKA